MIKGEGQQRVISLAAEYEEAHEETHKRDQKLNLEEVSPNDEKPHGSMTWRYIFEIPPKPLGFLHLVRNSIFFALY